MIEFYSSIAEYYDDIFSGSDDQAEFMMNSVGFEKGSRLLDIGCATGSLSLNLAEKGILVSAFDLDEKMIHAALNKRALAGLKDNPDFFELDMRHLKNRFSAESFDAAVSLGNTLPHLNDEDDIFKFFDGLNFVLKKGASFVLQILNYDYILKQRLECLPVIENEVIRFERYYDFISEQSIAFNTVLTVKKSKKVINNSVRLNPMNFEKVGDYLRQSGFKIKSVNGNFKGEELKEKSLPLIVVTEKE